MSAIILAGGRSSRMGTPKALLPFAGEPLIAHIVRRLQRSFDEIIIVAAPEQRLPDLPVTLVRDEVAFQGPVGGIYYGLRAARRETGFVTSCDSAFASESLISHLLSLSSGFDVVVPRWGGRLQPLHAVYRRTVLPFLEAQLANDELRPVFLYDKVDTRIVEEDEIRHFDPDGDSFFNMNTPDDYETALRRWPLADAGALEAGCSRLAFVDAASNQPPITLTVELLGVAQLLTGTRETTITLPDGGTVADALAALSLQLPALVGSVTGAARGSLVEGYACNVNGREFVKDTAATPVHEGDRIILLSADAGG